MPITRPIIFLDFDGVLNTPATWGKRRDDAVDADKVARLAALVNRTNAYVVISSTWRRIYTLLELQSFLTKKGLVDKILGITGGDDRGWRGNEITDWRKEIDHTGPYVILDDMGIQAFKGLDKHLVQIDAANGLTDEDCERAAKVLEGDK